MDELTKLMNERDRHLEFGMKANDLFLDILGVGALENHPDLLDRVRELLFSKPGQVKK